MSKPVRVHNPSQFEVVIDQEGHSLGGNTAGQVVPDALTESLIASGRLLERPKEPFPASVTASPKTTKTRNTVTASGNGSETGE
jgi:hypothetical protein